MVRCCCMNVFKKKGLVVFGYAECKCLIGLSTGSICALVRKYVITLDFKSEQCVPV